MNENNQNIEKAAQEYARNINPEMYHRKLDIDWLIEQLINFQTENQNGYIGSLVKRFGEVVAEKQKYKELYEKECKNHKAQEQKPVWTDELVLMIVDMAHHNGYHRHSQRCVELFDEVKKQASGAGYIIPDWIKEHFSKQH